MQGRSGRGAPGGDVGHRRGGCGEHVGGLACSPCSTRGGGGGGTGGRMQSNRLATGSSSWFLAGVSARRFDDRAPRGTALVSRGSGGGSRGGGIRLWQGNRCGMVWVERVVTAG
uniref:Uncharacterized protein n=1 Tax=Knipowitschia caucasica TaxID=637954 RepID=A0AAV2MEX3_KNICA